MMIGEYTNQVPKNKDPPIQPSCKPLGLSIYIQTHTKTHTPILLFINSSTGMGYIHRATDPHTPYPHSPPRTTAGMQGRMYA
ncbi:hypothetical protein EON63_25065 [archaeon]|nr:MAG: hypothetical protein EON63_25065 [archaeon]